MAQDKITAKVEQAEANLEALVVVKDAFGAIDGRTLDPVARGAFKEAKANLTQTLSAHRANIKVLKAAQKEAAKA